MRRPKHDVIKDMNEIENWAFKLYPFVPKNVQYKLDEIMYIVEPYICKHKLEENFPCNGDCSSGCRDYEEEDG